MVSRSYFTDGRREAYKKDQQEKEEKKIEEKNTQLEGSQGISSQQESTLHNLLHNLGVFTEDAFQKILHIFRSKGIDTEDLSPEKEANLRALLVTMLSFFKHTFDEDFSEETASTNQKEKLQHFFDTHGGIDFETLTTGALCEAIIKDISPDGTRAFVGFGGVDDLGNYNNGVVRLYADTSKKYAIGDEVSVVIDESLLDEEKQKRKRFASLRDEYFHANEGVTKETMIPGKPYKARIIFAYKGAPYYFLRCNEKEILFVRAKKAENYQIGDLVDISLHADTGKLSFYEKNKINEFLATENLELTRETFKRNHMYKAIVSSPMEGGKLRFQLNKEVNYYLTEGNIDNISNFKKGDIIYVGASTYKPEKAKITFVDLFKMLSFINKEIENKSSLKERRYYSAYITKIEGQMVTFSLNEKCSFKKEMVFVSELAVQLHEKYNTDSLGKYCVGQEVKVMSIENGWKIGFPKVNQEGEKTIIRS